MNGGRQLHDSAKLMIVINRVWSCTQRLSPSSTIAHVRTLHLSSTSSQTPTLPRARLDGDSHTSLTIPKAALQVTFLFEHVSYPHFQRQMRPLGIKKGVYEASRISIYICKSSEPCQFVRVSELCDPARGDGVAISNCRFIEIILEFVR